MIKIFFFFSKESRRSRRASVETLFRSTCPAAYRFVSLSSRFIGVREVLDLIARRKLAVPGVGDVVVSRHTAERASRDTWAEP